MMAHIAGGRRYTSTVTHPGWRILKDGHPAPFNATGSTLKVQR
jgi:hypothetical protein